MKKIKPLPSPKIWEPANNRRVLKLPKPAGIFDMQPDVRSGETKRLTNKGGRLHCEDGPAVVFKDNGYEWWKDGRLHRDDDQPAVSFQDGNSCSLLRCSGFLGMRAVPFTFEPGTEVWCKDGLMHREGQPALQLHSKNRGSYYEYWCNGRLHNATGPAIRANFTNSWFYHGLVHRADGPAIEITAPSNERFLWVWYGHVLLANGAVMKDFPFADPPASYLLVALLNANFSQDLVDSFPLLLPHILELMPNFERDASLCSDQTSWELVQALIRKALNIGQSEEYYALPADAFEEI